MNSLVFYKSFYEAIRELPADNQARVYNAVMAYQFEGVEPDFSGVEKAIWLLIKPQIDANNRRRENGAKGAEYGVKGGRPKNDAEQETPMGLSEKTPMGLSEETPMGLSVETPNVNVNDNVNVNVNDNVNANDNIYSSEPETVSEPLAAITLPTNTGKEYCITQDDISRWQELYPAVDVMQSLRSMKGWLDANRERRKTARGMPRFVNGWLEKEQNRGARYRPKNRFNSFEHSDYGDVSALEKELGIT